MKYNVYISDGNPTIEQFVNELEFCFGNNKEKAMRFVELILSVSNYNVWIYPIKEEK